MQIISVREQPEYKEKAIKYFQSKWANENSMKVYEDCITHSITTKNPLPIWYLMEDSGEIIGCAGLISNDFISRMDLWPWICALYIEKSYRGRSLGQELLLRARADAEKAGFNKVFLCTDHIGYYEKYGFTYIVTDIILGEAAQEFMKAITKIIIFQFCYYLFNKQALLLSRINQKSIIVLENRLFCAREVLFFLKNLQKKSFLYYYY